MDVEVVICSASGKPIFCYERRSGRPHDAPTASAASSGVSTQKSSFVSSLQGLLSFVACMQHEELQQMQTAGCRCFFQTRENLTFAIILRASTGVHSTSADGGGGGGGGGHVHNEEEVDTVPDIPVECLRRLIQLLHSQILFVLTERGLDVLRRQPGYDLRDLLSGTERVMTALCDRWAAEPTLRFKDLGVPFVRLPPDQRVAITRTLEFEPSPSAAAASSSSSSASGNDAVASAASAMICGVLLARNKIVAVSQPNKKQFSILIDDLLLLINFVYHTPSLAKSETWTPICLPSFNARYAEHLSLYKSKPSRHSNASLYLYYHHSGFLYAYVVFLTADVCLLLLSSQQSPEQFHSFHAKKEFMAQKLLSAGALETIHNSVQCHGGSWKPHGDLPLLTHFIYKNELTGECVTPELDFPFDDSDHDTSMQLLNQYAKLHHVMYPSGTTRTGASGQQQQQSQQKPGTKSQPLGKRLSGLHDSIASRLTFARSESGLFIGTCTDEYRLYACFDSLASVTEAKDQCQLLIERLRRDDGLMAPPFFVTGFGGSGGGSLSMWP